MPSSPTSLRSLLLVCGALLIPAASALAAFTTGDNVRNLVHDGTSREYNVFAPPGYDGGTPFPVVISFHGAGSDRVQEQVVSGWDDLATETQDFLAVFPLGTPSNPPGDGYTWNAGVCCGEAVALNVDDVGFVSAMVAAIIAEGNIDASRIYVTGISNGGAMTQRMACEAADLFAAAAPLAFPTPYVDFATECTPSQNMPVLGFMGLTDIVVPYENGTFGGAVESFESWRAKNGCDGPEAIEIQTPLGGSDCQIDTSCSTGKNVGLCSVTGSDLDPPFDTFNGHILYINDDGISIPTLAWNFFNTGTLEDPALLPGLGGLGAIGLAASISALGLLAAGRRRR